MLILEKKLLVTDLGLYFKEAGKKDEQLNPRFIAQNK